MAKANTTKTADKADKKAKGAEQMSTVLEAPKPDKDRAPREDNYGKKERQTPKEDINARDEGKDKVYGVASRARWGGTETIQELSQDAQAAEESANENRE
ncbi:hypothetical protein AXL3_08 [Stenotrophomonas phage vB_SmaS-AXL_3]|uniref:Uncharacterized protein n=1 Tax=Stenotrophomonas phage vB_SmaS-AXL_3 TaxID=2740427 RepID=A0A7D4XWF0_9CAUD|nr:hypothetical protein PQE62_gp08 [Stenotrophomonas phage vB_SmaS-AXL_3]QKW95609.1 hypothetical protein AXL3_08 [Stenotrophomonas phage vB_SmaS-AXL_3]